ncbi:MAG: protein TolR [Deltaproteobacteria bacterium]|nr:MAG: protein TolR [Deltaproteobacteria bacterium]
MGMSSGGGPGSTMSDINVTPLVDVMLVLLIIFMITAPLMNQGVEIDLPRASAQPLEGDEDQLVLSIDKDLKHYLNDNEIPVRDLESRLAAIAREAPGQPVFVRADASIEYRYVIRAMAALKNAGMPKVGLVSNPGALEGMEDEE